MDKFLINPPKMKEIDFTNCGEVISLTFGDQGENHVGMEKVGEMVDAGQGFNITDFQNYKQIFENKGLVCELHHLNDLISETDHSGDDAFVLVIRNGLSYFLEKKNKTSTDLYNEMKSFKWDRKYYDTRRKKVLNKNARANVCFGDVGVEPDYENKIGRIVGYKQLPCLKMIRDELSIVLGHKGENLICEGNRYFDLRKCGIGWHGDAERRKVIAFRLGESMDLHFNWFYKYSSVGKTLKLTLNCGDMYLMSEKAVGWDWRRGSILTLRHSAGKEGSTYLKINK